MLTKLLLVLSCIPILLSLGTLAFPFDHDGVSDEPTLENGLRKYIVVFKTDISRDDIRAHYRDLNFFTALQAEHVDEETTKPAGEQRVLGVFNIINKQLGVEELESLNTSEFRENFRAYSAYLLPNTVRAFLMRRPEIDYIEPSKIVRASNVTVDETFKLEPILEEGFGDSESNTDIGGNEAVQYNAPWHLTRLWQRTFSDHNRFVYDSLEGAGATVYVLDTGVRHDHVEFGGRIRLGPQFGQNPHDFSGHGTYVAGLIGSKTYGVAKSASIVSVKVLGDNGMGLIPDVINGISFALNDARSNQKRAIVNMEFWGGYSQALNDAISAASRTGDLLFISAGGNGNNDACFTSPASEISVLAVASALMNDGAASYANQGPCIELFAPAQQIASTSHSSRSALVVGNGIPSPIVAGIAALILGRNPLYTAQQVSQKILEIATKNALYGVKYGTPNLLAFNRFA